MARNQNLAVLLLAQLLVLEAGCGAEPRETPSPVPELAATATATVTVPAKITFTAPTSSTSAERAPSIPDRLTGAPALIYRALDTGVLNARSTLVTRTLQRFESEALLTVAVQTVDNSELTATHLEPFAAPATRRFIGTATTTGEKVTFDLVDGHEKLLLECEMGTVAVAAANAVRASSGRGGCNGDRGHWVPTATKRVEALRCGINNEPDPSYKPDRLEEMAFTASPGIEFLFVNDDCVMQGGGYRFVPPDRAVRAIRLPGAR